MIRKVTFHIVEATEGGVDWTDADYDAVVSYLDRTPVWRYAKRSFVAKKDWAPGEFLHYPCGTIYCVWERV